ncbi:putative ABC transporter-associated repeat protein [Lentzea xinjiangensis]|uniref:Putative ABC transporter-associated repeat protein n=1 Tax=Lentzea xinjiangensis TaxID=402600 RepID=A0A1H9NEH0_9PSEU|nr:choice-of-anchor M domain-containing protein [Lentzea xinjiangensis]SER34302.1 putative ABC transporter-associated repeat protein [Lentzea xinjiangensis]
MRIRAGDRNPKRRGAAAAVVAAVVAVVAAPAAAAAPGPAPAPPQRQVIAGGHVDLATVLLENGALTVKGKGDAGPFDPAATTLNVTDAAKRPAPSSPAYGFLGVPGGTPIHVIPQTFQPEVLWAGWNTESVPRGALADNVVDLTLRAARGPGRMEVYVSGTDGPERVFSSHDPAVRTTRVAVPTHAHANWAFTAPGVYELEFEASATSVSGARLISPPARYTVVVGPHNAVATTTTLAATETPAGLRLSSTVTGGPQSIDGGVPRGWVEFVRHTSTRDEVVAHEPLSNGTAGLALAADAEALAFTARFVPAADDLLARSQSSPVANPGAPSGAVVTGVRDTYAQGETITATALVTPHRPGHTVTWWTRKAGAGTERGTGAVLTLAAGLDLHGAELGFDVRDGSGATVVSARPMVLDVRAAVLTTAPPAPATTPPGTTTAAPPKGAPPAAATTQACVPTPVTSTVPPGEVEVVTDGHFDFGPVVEGGAFSARVKDDRRGTPAYRDPASYVFHLGDAARATPPPGSGLDFLGSGPVWTIPLTQRSGVPWLGWNTQHPSVLASVKSGITLTLDKVDGPGELAVYGQDPFGGVGDRYFGTVGGFPRATTVPVGQSGVHVHAVWAFTKPGSYSVTFSIGGSIDGRPANAKSTLAFHIGPGDPKAARTGTPVVEQVGRTADGKACALPSGLASTGLDGSAVAGLVVAAVLLIPLGFLLTNLATLADVRRRR